MTRTEFIKKYCDASGIDESDRRHWGYDLGNGMKSYALPCHCEDATCEGWAMLNAGNVLGHLEIYYHPDENEVSE